MMQILMNIRKNQQTSRKFKITTKLKNRQILDENMKKTATFKKIQNLKNVKMKSCHFYLLIIGGSDAGGEIVLVSLPQEFLSINLMSWNFFMIFWDVIIE